MRTRPIGVVAGIRLHDCDDRRAGPAANSHLPYEVRSLSWHMSKLCKIKNGFRVELPFQHFQSPFLKLELLEENPIVPTASRFQGDTSAGTGPPDGPAPACIRPLSSA